MGREIVIVGGGLSGTAVAIRLLEAISGPTTITVFEPAKDLARGIAYGTECDRHLLNVRAIGMSLYPDQPRDFVEWLIEKGIELPDPIEKQFAPRMVYRAYVQDRLDRAIRQRRPDVQFRHLRETATTIDSDGVVTGSGGTTVRPTQLILALGNLAPRLPGLLNRLAESHRVARDPWRSDFQSALASDGTVLVIGTGLTMIDVVLQLREGGFTGKIFAMSRRGLLPQVHEDVPPIEQAKPSAETALGLVRDVVRRTRSAKQDGINWRSVIDGLRPYNQTSWGSMPVAERHRFMKHLQTYWDIHRHRIAPSIAKAIVDEMEAGSLVVMGGRVVSAIESMQGIEVTIHQRNGKERVILADQLVNCTGPTSDWHGSHVPIIDAVVHHRLASYDPFGMGLEVDEHCRCVVAHPGQVETYAVGPMTKGTFWESTAVPEIRVQAQSIARAVASPT